MRFTARSACRAGMLGAYLSLIAVQPARSQIDPALVADATAANNELVARLSEPSASILPRLSQQRDGAWLLTPKQKGALHKALYCDIKQAGPEAAKHLATAKAALM